VSDHRIHGRVLIAAGSDSGGGAGIQADIKTVTALGGYAATAITALTAQNTVAISAIQEVPPAFVSAQLRDVLSDIGADCIKTGMMFSTAVIEAVSDVLDNEARNIPVVVDPVLVGKSGDVLLKPEAMQALKARLILRATVITPNLPEAEALTGMTIDSVSDMIHAAEMLHTLGVPAILLKGGHLKGDVITDVLLDENGVRRFEDTRIDSKHTHGTGCTLASAVAAGLAQGMPLLDAVERARAYVRRAIETAPGFGAGQRRHVVRVAVPGSVPEGCV